MRTQQQAEKEEQQRIKNLVLNYDLRDEAEADGDPNFHYILQPNFNRPVNKQTVTETTAPQGIDKTHSPYIQPRIDKAGNNRSHQRARKLQLSDVDWYGKKSPSTLDSTTSAPASAAGNGLATPGDEQPARSSAHDGKGRRGGRRAYRTFG